MTDHAFTVSALSILLLGGGCTYDMGPNVDRGFTCVPASGPLDPALHPEVDLGDVEGLWVLEDSTELAAPNLGGLEATITNATWESDWRHEWTESDPPGGSCLNESYERSLTADVDLDGIEPDGIGLNMLLPDSEPRWAALVFDIPPGHAIALALQASLSSRSLELSGSARMSISGDLDGDGTYILLYDFTGSDTAGAGSVEGEMHRQ